ncbi:hypothetical protein [Alicyclobacillus fodiniaquatilis]|uniref:BMP family ABC transporter substrate-binding protein n=1 Tax=Alicyclobacillus fodiniaquatilis TaxID=1661150 RepID=A0ABW4JEB1_9BACL
MKVSKPYIASSCIILTALMVSGCGAPDLAAMKPHVTKSAGAVILVDNPNFVAPKDLQSNQGKQLTSVETIQATTASFASNVTSALKNRHVSLCLIAADNANPLTAEIQKLASAHPNVHFEVVSNQTLTSLQSSEIGSIVQDEDAVAFAIGSLAGTWATTEVQALQLTKQPIFGYVQGNVSKDAQKAFFAGLFTEDPNADIEPMTPLNGTTANVTPIYPTVTAIAAAGQLNASLLQTVQETAPVIFDVDDASDVPNAAVKPGHLGSSHLQNVLSEFATGQWQARAESVVDQNSVLLDTGQLPSQVMSAWHTLQPSLAQAPAQWQAAFQNLPAATRQMLQTKFGIV